MFDYLSQLLGDKAFVAVLSSILGVLAKTLFDWWTKRGYELDSLRLKKQVELLETQLSQFFWPLYIRLCKDTVIWERILDKNNPSGLEQKIGAVIEEKIIMPNHGEILKLIEAKMHLAHGDGLLMEELKKYLKHISVYQALQEAGEKDKFPEDVGEPWPQALIPLVEDRVYALQARYDELLKLYHPSRGESPRVGRITSMPVAPQAEALKRPAA